MIKPMMKILLVAVKTASKSLYSSHEGCWDPKFEPSVEDVVTGDVIKCFITMLFFHVYAMNI